MLKKVLIKNLKIYKKQKYKLENLKLLLPINTSVPLTLLNKKLKVRYLGHS